MVSISYGMCSLAATVDTGTWNCSGILVTAISGYATILCDESFICKLLRRAVWSNTKDLFIFDGFDDSFVTMIHSACTAWWKNCELKKKFIIYHGKVIMLVGLVVQKVCHLGEKHVALCRRRCLWSCVQ